MSNVMMVLLLLLAWFAGRLFVRVILRPILAPRFTFDEAGRLFVSREVNVQQAREVRMRRQAANTETEVTLFVAQVRAKNSKEVADYAVDTTQGDELITIYDPNHKNMQIALRSGDIVHVDHGGLHEKSDFTHSELSTLINLCARIRNYVRSPAVSKS